MKELDKTFNTEENYRAPTTEYKGNSDVSSVEDNYQIILEYGLYSLGKLKQISEEGDHPRVFEAMSALIKSVSDTNKDLADFRMKNKEFDIKQQDRNAPEKEKSSQTTEDLLNSLRKVIKEEKENDTTED